MLSNFISFFVSTNSPAYFINASYSINDVATVLPAENI